MTIRLNDRDEQITGCLAVNVRLFSRKQISRHWFSGDNANARRRLDQLASHNLMQQVSVRARSLPPMETPIVNWRPGEPAPDFGKASHQCRARWRMRPVRTIVAYVATELTANLFGGRCRHGITKDLQVTHDLGVSQIWLTLSMIAPHWADAWKGEDVMAHTRYRQKLPDAFIVDVAGLPVCAQEFAGSYSRERIRDFHIDNQKRNLSYQLW